MKGMNKTLANNYRKLNVNVRKDEYEVWKEYAESKGTSLYGLVHQFFEDAMKADGFVPSKKPEE